MSFCTTTIAVAVFIKTAMAQAPSVPNTNTTEGAGSAGTGAEMSPPKAPEALQIAAAIANFTFQGYILIILASLIAFLGGWRVLLESRKYIRTLACLGNSPQNYFSRPSWAFASFKSHLLYAPIFRKRHSREFQLSAAVNMGTIPTRFQLLFLTAYFGTNVAFCVISIAWDQSFTVVAGQLRDRTGTLAVVNMIPLFLMAGRNNPLINWLALSFDSFNLLHRWLGRIVVLEALVHAGSFMAGVAKHAGWAAAVKITTGDPMTIFGLIAVFAFVLISLQAMSAVRHAFYETFKVIHVSLVILAIIGLWYHLRLDKLPQIALILGVIISWSVEHFIRIGRVVYRNVGNGGTKTLVEALPGDAVRVTVYLARPWTFKPGQHAYLYMPSIALWTSHPFSIAWSDGYLSANEKGGLICGRNNVLALQKTSMSFVIRARTGFTAKLHKIAKASWDGRFHTKCFAEGPYGGLYKMHSYGTVILIAGGIGITHQVSHVRDLVAGFANGTVATRKLVLIWVIQKPEHIDWTQPWMKDILAMDQRQEILRVKVFVSRPRSDLEIRSPSAMIQMFPGRPNVEVLLDMEIDSQIGAMGVSVCGSGSLSDDVRKVVRSRQHVSHIDFVEEAFSW